MEQSDNLEAEIMGDNVLDGNTTQLLDSLDINKVLDQDGNFHLIKRIQLPQN